jgi:hypothetical protein
MAESVAKRTNSMANHRDAEAMRKVLGAVQTDLAALRASFVLLTAKLDADVGVTDTNYGALTNPVAQSTTA